MTVIWTVVGWAVLKDLWSFSFNQAVKQVLQKLVLEPRLMDAAQKRAIEALDITAILAFFVKTEVERCSFIQNEMEKRQPKLHKSS